MRAQEIGAENWDIQSGTQILDTCRRRKLVEEPILEDLTRWFQNTLDRHNVQSLTQATWCLVSLKRALPLDGVLRLFVQWHEEKILTPMQLAHVNFVLKQVREADEDEFLSVTMNFPQCHTFLRTVFAIPADFHRTQSVLTKPMEKLARGEDEVLLTAG